MKAGKLRHRIAFYEVKETQNAIGEAVKQEVFKSYAWALIEPISGNERFLSNTTYADANTRIKSRFVDGITPKCIIKFDTRTFNIISVSNIYEKRVELNILAKEAV